MPKNIPKKQIIFLEGHSGHSAFLVLKGSIQIYKGTPDGREIVIKVLGPGEMFAEVVLFEENTYPVNASALSEAELLIIPRIQFGCLLEDESFRKDFIAMLMKKQRYLTERILALTAEDVESRLFRFLSEHYGRMERYKLSLSKKDIASAIAANPETLSRLIQRLTKEKKIEWKGRELKVASTVWTDGDDIMV